jgi:AraC-like DNA-binding protein
MVGPRTPPSQVGNAAPRYVPAAEGRSPHPDNDSIPSTRGNVTFGECPWRMRSSDRFKPAPFICTRLSLPDRWDRQLTELENVRTTRIDTDRRSHRRASTVTTKPPGRRPVDCRFMPVGRQPPRTESTSQVWPSGGAHLWPPGGTSSVHSHPRGHLVYAARGVLSVRTERGTSIVPANRVAWIPAGFAHYHRAHGHTDMRIEFLPASLARLVPDHPAVFTASDLAREMLLTLTGSANNAPGHDRSARARLRRVLVDELHEAQEQPLQLPEPRDDRLQAVAQILHNNPADNTALAEIGQTIGASARTLSRLFHDELGMTFYEWRTQLRIYHALVLLADGHDTARVAHACGWANPSSFIAAFTAIIGTTPGRHRTSHPRSSRS